MLTRLDATGYTVVNGLTFADVGERAYRASCIAANRGGIWHRDVHPRSLSTVESVVGHQFSVGVCQLSFRAELCHSERAERVEESPPLGMTPAGGYGD